MEIESHNMYAFAIDFFHLLFHCPGSFMLKHVSGVSFIYKQYFLGGSMLFSLSVD